MTTWTPISRESHAKAHWRPRMGFQFAANSQVTEVLITEVSTMLPHYLMGFMEAEDGHQMVALIGLGGEQNLYVNLQLQWLCDVVPAAFRGYPFALLTSEESGEKILCIDDDYLIAEDSISDKEESFPIFNNEGAPEERTAKVLEFFKKCDLDRERTRAACQSLADAGLLKPWPISVQSDTSDKPSTISGLLKIDEAALNELDASSLANIRDSAGLFLAYSHLLSTNQISQLSKRAQVLNKEFVQNEENKKELSELFSDDSGTLNFDILNP